MLRSTFATAAVLCSSIVLLAGCPDDPAKDKPAATVGPAVSVSAPAKPLAPAMSVVASAATAAGSAVASAAEAIGSAVAPVPGGLVVNETNSKIGFIGAKITGKHVGSFQKFTGSIVLVDGNATKSKVTIDIDMSSLKTDQEKLDAHLKSKDFFDVEQFGHAKFVSTSITAGGTKGATHMITGNLELHGVTKSISFPAAIAVVADGVTATAEFTINRKDFGVVYAGKADDLIKDDVVITLAVKATKGN